MQSSPAGKSPKLPPNVATSPLAAPPPPLRGYPRVCLSPCPSRQTSKHNSQINDFSVLKFSVPRFSTHLRFPFFFNLPFLATPRPTFPSQMTYWLQPITRMASRRAKLPKLVVSAISDVSACFFHGQLFAISFSNTAIRSGPGLSESRPGPPFIRPSRIPSGP